MQLYKPVNFVKKKCNGCGTGWNAKLVPNTIYFLNIKNACCIHDYMYEVGKTQEDKEEADRVFLNNMLRIIEAKKTWYYPHHLARTRALTYYATVVNFGSTAFWEGKNNEENIIS